MFILGLIAIFATAYAFSEDRSKINWRTVIGAFVILVVFAVIALYVPLGRAVISGMATGISAAVHAGQSGIEFVFGPLANGQVGFVFAVSVLATIVFFSSLMSVLYFIRVMPLIINTLGLGLHKLIKTSRSESLSATANIFIGQSEAPLVIKPYLKYLTRSELFAVMVGGLSTVAGAVLAGLIVLGINSEALIAASFMAAPAGLLLAKIMVPETETPVQTLEEVEEKDLESEGEVYKPSNIVEAAADGASSGLTMALTVGAMLMAFIGLITMVDLFIGYLSTLAGLQDPITFKQILGFLFSPVAFLIGVPWSEANIVGNLIGEKLIFNEFVAFISLSENIANLSPKTQLIATFALCGFANISSIGILMGGIGSLAPTQKKTIANLAFRALLAGTLANLLSATLASVLVVV